MHEQDDLKNGKGPDRKIWIVVGIILLIVIIGTVAVVLLSGKKKSDGDKNPVIVEKSEETDKETPKKITDSSTSSTSKVTDSSTSGTSKVPENGDQDKIKDQNDVKDTDSREYDKNQASVGLYVVYLNGWTAAQRDGGLYLTKDGKEVWKHSGEHGQSLMLTNEGLFYVTGEGWSELNYYDLHQGTEKQLTNRYYGINPFGIMDGKVYFSVNQDGIDNAAMKYKIVELNLSDGKEQMISLPDVWGDFTKVFCNGKFYYLGGRSDISTTPLYVADLESGNTTIMDKSTAQGLMTDGTSIFYLHCDASAYTEKSPVQLIEFNTDTQKTETLLQDTYGNVGWIRYVDRNYVLLQHYEQEKEYLRIYDRRTKKSKDLDSQGEQYLSFIQGEDSGFYFVTFSNHIKDGVSYGQAPYHVFYYDYGEQKVREVGSTEAYVMGVADRYIYYVKWENQEPKPGRVPFGNVASPQEIPDLLLEANTAKYILPDSDSRYYDRADLEKLNYEELRLARNEIYARHGYIFESEDLKKHFMSKSWYVPSVKAEQFDPGVLNQYEKANLQLILDYEKERGGK